VGAVVVVLQPPVLDQELGFVEGVEGFHVEQLVSEVAVERFGVGILPRSTGLDVGGGGVVEAAPVVECLGDELGTVVAADEAR
jgi:hypothetical protein